MKFIFSMFCILCSSVIFSQSSLFPADPVNVGLAGSGGAHMSPSAALLFHPAAMMTPNYIRMEIGVGGSGIFIGSNRLNYEFYETYFTGEDGFVLENGNQVKKIVPKKLSDQDKADIISKFSPNASIFSTGQSMPIGVMVNLASLGRLGFAYMIKGDATTHIPKDYIRYAFNGIQPGDQYNLKDFFLSGQLRQEFQISYANKLPIFIPYISHIFWGISLKYVQGLAFLEISELSHTAISNPTTYELTHSIKYNTRMAGNNRFATNVDATLSDDELYFNPAGHGFGIDFSTSFYFGENASGYIAISDIGFIRWTENALTLSNENTFEFKPIERTPEGTTNNDYDVDSVKRAYTPIKEIGSFSAPLPTILHIGGRIKYSELPFFDQFAVTKNVWLFASYQQGLNEAPGNTFSPRFSLGSEYQFFDHFKIRSGVSLGGLETFTWGFGGGFYLGMVSVDLGTANLHHLFFDTESSGFSISFGLKFTLNN